MIISRTKKYSTGTKMTLLVLARKSAAASTTLIATFKELKPHHTEHAKIKLKIPKTKTPAKYFEAGL